MESREQAGCGEVNVVLMFQPPEIEHMECCGAWINERVSEVFRIPLTNGCKVKDYRENNDAAPSSPDEVASVDLQQLVLNQLSGTESSTTRASPIHRTGAIVVVTIHPSQVLMSPR